MDRFGSVRLPSAILRRESYTQGGAGMTRNAATWRRFVTGIFTFMLVLSAVPAFGVSTANAATSAIPKPKVPWTEEQKCDWLGDKSNGLGNYQNADKIKQLVADIVNAQNPDLPAVTPEQVLPTKYGECDKGGYDGGTVMGPGEGFDAVRRHIVIPPTGVVAAYKAPADQPDLCGSGEDAPMWTGVEPFLFAGGSDNPCNDTWIGEGDGKASFDGLSFTVYFFDDFDAPVKDKFDPAYYKSANDLGNGGDTTAGNSTGGGAKASPTPAEAKADCSKQSATMMSSVDLANSKGWDTDGNVIDYGGLFVTYHAEDTLPACWEADGSYNDADGTQVTYHIAAADKNRKMKVGANGDGYATVYPPCADRSDLGVKACGS